MPKSIRCQRLSTEDIEIAIICPDFEIGIRPPVPLIEHVFDQVVLPSRRKRTGRSSPLCSEQQSTSNFMPTAHASDSRATEMSSRQENGSADHSLPNQDS